MILVPGSSVVKLFDSSLTVVKNKLERLFVPDRFFGNSNISSKASFWLAPGLTRKC